jgi:hypothetical protein
MPVQASRTQLEYGTKLGAGEEGPCDGSSAGDEGANACLTSADPSATIGRNPGAYRDALVHGPGESSADRWMRGGVEWAKERSDRIPNREGWFAGIT